MVAGQQSLSPLTDGLINDNLTEVTDAQLTGSYDIHNT